MGSTPISATKKTSIKEVFLFLIIAEVSILSL
jgi:hypothetical protein